MLRLSAAMEPVGPSTAAKGSSISTNEAALSGHWQRYWMMFV